ncbi:hypothetical protein Tco_0462095, partial [Tanacetum coccineum]
AEDCALSMDATGVSRILSGGGLEYLNLSRGKRKGDGLAAIGLGLASNLKILDFGLPPRCFWIIGAGHHGVLAQEVQTKLEKMVICGCGKQACIQTSRTDRKPDRRFYYCLTLLPPMCHRALDVIHGLLRASNGLEDDLVENCMLVSLPSSEF